MQAPCDLRSKPPQGNTGSWHKHRRGPWLSALDLIATRGHTGMHVDALSMNTLLIKAGLRLDSQPDLMLISPPHPESVVHAGSHRVKHIGHTQAVRKCHLEAAAQEH